MVLLIYAVMGVVEVGCWLAVSVRPCVGVKRRLFDRSLPFLGVGLWDC